MDDTKTIAEPTRVVVIGDTEYPVTRPDQATAERVGVALALNAPEEIKLRSAGVLIQACLGKEAWAEVLSSYLDGDISTADVTGVLKQIGDILETPSADA